MSSKLYPVYYPVDDEKDKGAVKRRLCAVVGGALVFGIIGPIAVCTKNHN